MFEKVYAQWGGVDVVFANAGITELGDLVKSALEDGGNGRPVKPDLKTVDVNLLGVVYCMSYPSLYLENRSTNDDGRPSGHTLHLQEYPHTG